MATRYTATVWPPISFPLPTSFGRNGGTARAPTAPGAVLPTATSLGRNGGFSRPPTAPAMQLPSFTGRLQTFTPAALPTTQRQTTYVKPFTTQQTTNNIFKIVNGSNVVTNPYPLA